MSERRLPLDGQVLASTDFNEPYDTNRTIVTDLEQANLITSMIAEPDGSVGDLHKVVLDVDHPVKVVESSIPGHFHLFIDVEMEWPEYLALLRGFVVANIVEPGYLAAAERRKYTAVRLPWIRKTPAVPVPVSPSCPGCQSTDRAQRHLAGCGLPCDYAWHESAVPAEKEVVD